jgi:hypothetical protein
LESTRLKHEGLYASLERDDDQAQLIAKALLKIVFRAFAVFNAKDKHALEVCLILHRPIKRVLQRVAKLIGGNATDRADGLGLRSRNCLV